MIKLLVSCILVALAVWAGVAMQASHGFIGMNVAGWTVEVPIWLAIIALMMLSVMMASLIKVIRILINLKKFFRQLRTERRLKRAKAHTTEGVFAFLEGNWQEAENALIKGSSCIDLPFINYMFAAKAAVAQNHFEQAEQYLEKAKKITKEEDRLAFSLKKAQWLCQQEKWTEAQALLEPLLLQKQHMNRVLLKWLYKIYKHQKQWAKIIQWVPFLIKSKEITEPEGFDIQKHAYGELLLQAEATSVEAVKNYWKDLPKLYHQDNHLVYVYVRALLQHHLEDEAESVLRLAIKHQWSEVLIKLYGKIKSSTPQKQLAFAEHWLKMQPKSAPLLLTVGRICLHHQLWGKAQRYLEASIALSPHPETFAELGKLLMKLNKLEEAADYFRDGLLMLTTHRALDKKPLLASNLNMTSVMSKLEPAEDILQD